MLDFAARAYELETGKQGYWGSTRDRRWSQSAAEFKLFKALTAAGTTRPGPAGPPNCPRTGWP